MRLLNILLLALFVPLFSFAQANHSTRQLRFQLSPKTTTKPADLKRFLKIAPDNSLKKLKQSESYGIQHTRYQQFHEGHRIIGAGFVVHTQPNNEVSVNGQWISQFSRKGSPEISEQKAIQVALQSCDKNSQFYWEVPALENQRLRTKGKSYYPTPQLVWYDKNFGTDPAKYRLAYEMDVHVFKPIARYKIYVDAQTGRLIHKYNNLHATNVPVTAESFYSGPVDIVVDSLSPTSFTLSEAKRKGHSNISTYDFESEELIADANNHWNETGEEPNAVAIDVHWGVEKTIDFFDEVFGRQGMDNQGRDILAYVHMQEPNAYYDGEAIFFGDASVDLGTTAFTPLIIVAHEFTHGVTESEANLIYEGESGAINESMSDIFGATIEHAVSPAGFNWTLGEKVNYVIRKMNDPKSLHQPSTYGGDYWDPFGDVHVSSAIGNLWYYLLVEGGTGTNDNDFTYNVQGIGFDKAKVIVYEALTNYLTETSDYQAFRDATLTIANNLYGHCSSEYHSVADAWQAVGVGEALRNNDLKVQEISHPQTSCGLASESIDVKLKYNSCPDSLPAGSTIKMYYSINGETPVSEDYVTTEPIFNEQYIHYIFNTPYDFSAGIDYVVKVWIDNPNDSYTPNDVIITHIKNRSNIARDFALISLDNVSSIQCDNTLNSFNIGVRYIGCESVPDGTTLPVTIHLGDLSENINLTTATALSDGDTSYYTITPSLTYANTTGDADFKVELKFPNDPNQNNDDTLQTLSFYEAPSQVNPFYFSSEDDIDRLHVVRGQYVNTTLYPLTLADHTSTSDQALLVSGGDYYGDNGPNFEEVVSIDQVWDFNKGFISNICICVDATTWDSVIVDFDMQQQAAELYDYIGIDPSFYCNMRLKVNGTVVSPTYHPSIDTAYYHHEQYVLNQYAGQVFNLCFETQNIIPSTFAGAGDDLNLDNIFVRPHAVVANHDLEDNPLKISTYPNPTKDKLELQVTLDGSQNIDYTLHNTSGQQLLNGHFRATYHHAQEIDLSNLAAGIYYLKVYSKLGNRVIRVVKTL